VSDIAAKPALFRRVHAESFGPDANSHERLSDPFHGQHQRSEIDD
jgi:hypothetical protein